jgi:hypothetical protein
MPVHINEIVIRAVVGGSQERRSAPAPGGERLDREAIIAECVEQVMELLAQRRER